jgi:hypothetical protein
MRARLRGRFYKAVKEQYSFWSTLTNAMIALGMAGITLLGVLSPLITTVALVGWGVFLALTYFIGKFLDQQIEDMDKVYRRESSGEYHPSGECKHEENT